MSGIAARLQEVRGRIEVACRRGGRDRSEVELLAVSKTYGVHDLKEAVAAGQSVFAESRLQEAEPKIAAMGPGLSWHFIGSIQRNKVRRILSCCQVLHSVDSLRLAAYVSSVSSDLGIRPGVFLQVNVGGESSKSGFSPDELRREIEEIARLSALGLLGLMCIPPAADDPEEARAWFRRLRELRDEIQIRTEIPMPALSMGMSHDFEVAIEEGATHVRVGSAIFGTRSYRVDGELG